jgi:phosphatase NudJ
VAMSRMPIPSHYFVVVVVRDPTAIPSRYLLVHESKHGGGWYLPAGLGEPGETFEAAACRETLEESGLVVALTGVLRIEHTPMMSATRVRVIFLARPVDSEPPRAEPNEHTLGAAWYTLQDLDNLILRGPDVRVVLQRLEGGGTSYPLDLIADENDY